ncbi:MULTISPECIES: hypothetical protein [Streptomyces]|jgi:MYXO-CTERM domain-containing protein|uniref:DUF2530 domain-containing protein n=1 Tax=Streptomyces doudnae TaxID=3075536 RepID=A0ABD5EPN7_9ACTN|nr:MULTISPECIES: hypothetical protein [unclassified Streptomyces]MDT0436667.1 hypothetical protein [Streptomyces sp. DSM 41981]MYQ68428.1 hypothetical protein [Streptomyces sp. SID4950]SCE46135.1 MYXO-CTERM domain-containing protein [Streptomyces sp. SolWspMP-5a-2]
MTKSTAQQTGHPADRVDLPLVLLWSLVVISGTVNFVASFDGGSLWVQSVCGVVTAAGLTGLVLRRVRRRR